MQANFQFRTSDVARCVASDDLVTSGGEYAVRGASRPNQTLFQWLLVEVSPGRLEWVPHDRFVKAA